MTTFSPMMELEPTKKTTDLRERLNLLFSCRYNRACSASAALSLGHN
jgi:hypothetical protein